MDDWACAKLANENNILVVNLEYPLAPSHPFPIAINSLVDVVKAVLADEELPFDRKKVAIGGYSAGANLALAVSQNEELQGKFGGVVSFYGVMDFAEDASDKYESPHSQCLRDIISDC